MLIVLLLIDANVAVQLAVATISLLLRYEYIEKGGTGSSEMLVATYQCAKSCVRSWYAW
jgi:hypothetical protein